MVNICRMAVNPQPPLLPLKADHSHPKEKKGKPGVPTNPFVTELIGTPITTLLLLLYPNVAKAEGAVDPRRPRVRL
jgi:hypothetical protein